MYSLLIENSKGCKSNLYNQSLRTINLIVLLKEISNHLMAPVYFDAGVCTYTVFVAKYESYNG